MLRTVYCKKDLYIVDLLCFSPLEYRNQFENEGFNEWKNLNARTKIDDRIDNFLQVQIYE